MDTEFTDRLTQMLALQLDVQRRVQTDPTKLETDEERIAYFKDMILACTDELHEALHEVGWKPWATSHHLNEHAAFNELRDAWQFLMNAMFVITQLEPEGLSAELYVRHAEKVATNVKRAEDGYDGVSNKCPQCHRDLDEVELKRVPRFDSVIPRVDIHCPCGRRITSVPMMTTAP